MNKLSAQKGFTVMELMIATSIFSVILLVGVAGFVALSRSYFKGYTVTQTQGVAKTILDNVAANVRLSSSVSSLGTASGNRYYYCVGGNRYTFQLFKEINTSDHDNTSKFGLLADQPSGGGCGNPFDSPGTVVLKNPTELLGNNMRLLAFSIDPAGSAGGSAYSIKVTVASGADNVLSDPNSPTAHCVGTTQSAQFCAVTTLSTIVYEGLSV